MRCYWCDSDRFKGVMPGGEVLSWEDYNKGLETDPKALAVDFECAWCGHLTSEPNPRAGNPEETLDSVKEERDDIRAQLEQCMAELTGPEGLDA